MDQVGRESRANVTSGAPRPPAVGLQLAVVFAGSIAGFSAGLLAARLGPVGVIGLSGAACLLVFFMARIAADGEGAPVATLLVTLAWAFAYTLMLAGLGETMRPRRIQRDVAGVSLLFLGVMVIMAIAIAAPTAAAIVGVRRAATGPAPTPPTPSSGAPGVQLLLALSVFVAAMFALALTSLIRDPSWRITALLALVLVLPVAALAPAALVHRWALARRSTTPPEAFLAAIREIESRAGTSFGRILHVGDAGDNGRLCLVISVPWCATLACSADLVDRLTRPQLLAVLAHEAAHVRYRHTRRKLVWGTAAAIASLVTATAILYVLSPLFPGSFRLVAIFLAIFPLVVGRHLYDALVTRRHEAEADRFAVRIAGADALLEALRVVQGSGAPPEVVHQRWTTHGTWASRSRRIRECDEECLRTSAAETRRAD